MHNRASTGDATLHEVESRTGKHAILLGFSLSLSLSVVCLLSHSVVLWVYLSSVFFSFCLSVLSFFLSVCLSMCLLFNLFVCQSVCPSFILTDVINIQTMNSHMLSCLNISLPISEHTILTDKRHTINTHLHSCLNISLPMSEHSILTDIRRMQMRCSVFWRRRANDERLRRFVTSRRSLLKYDLKKKEKSNFIRENLRSLKRSRSF